MRISGVTIPDNKRLEIALTSIYGIGVVKAQKILHQAGVDAAKKVKQVSSKEEGTIRTLVENEKIEGELRRMVSGNIKRLKDIHSYRGTRHTKRLPARGQRTQTNARTLKGARKTMGSGRRKLDKK